LAGKLALQLTEGLIYTHRRGVVHGGLHPGNIILKPTGGRTPWQVMLTDFRLASLVPDLAQVELLPYLAPEKVSTRRTDARTDIYALGVILYQLTTGQLPYNAGTAEEAAATTATAMSPETFRPDMPPAFANIILKAVSRPIRERYRSMEEVMVGLRREIGDLPDTIPDNLHGSSYAPTPAPKPEKPAPRREPDPPPQPPKVEGEDALIISLPDERKQEYVVGERWYITIGQRAGNDLVLPAEGVSSKHARLELKEDGRWMVIDMTSVKGTFLGRDRLLPDAPQEWLSGQELRIGPYTLRWGKSGRVTPAAPQPRPKPQQEKPAPTPVSQPRLTMSLTPNQLFVTPGKPANEAVVEVNNTTDRPIKVTLRVEDIPKDWLVIEPGKVHLLPQQKVQIPLVAQPRRHHTSRAGQHSFRISAVSTNGDVNVASCSGQLTIAPFSQLLTEVDPSPLRHKHPAKVTIQNQGNNLERVTLSAADVNKEITFEMPQTQTAIEPGGSDSLPFQANGKKRPYFLQPKIAPFDIQVHGSERPYVSTERLLIPAILSPVILGVAACMVLCLALIIALPVFCNTDDGKDLAAFGQGLFRRVCTTDSNETAKLEATDTPVVDATNPNTTLTSTLPVETAVSTIEPTVANTSVPQQLIVEPNRTIIGYSVNETPIEAVSFGSGPNAIIFIGGLHGSDSSNSVNLANAVINYFIEHPEEEEGTIPTSVTIFIIANINPDGAEAGTRENAHNVDLNRNWSCGWSGQDGSGGSAELSEPETLALHEFINELDAVATVFWNPPVNPNNQGLVSPGRCPGGDNAISQELTDTYAGAVPSFQGGQADPDAVTSGDATDSLAQEGIPSIFVLLPQGAAVDVVEHIPAIQAVMELYSGN
jgi:serine/threonine protein kinase